MDDRRRGGDEVILARLDMFIKHEDERHADILKHMDQRAAEIKEVLKDHEKRIRSLEVIKYAMHGLWAVLLAFYAWFDQIGKGGHSK